MDSKETSQRGTNGDAGVERALDRSSTKGERPTIDKDGDEVRYVPWNHPTDDVNSKFKKNRVSTAKYDRLFITFLPLFLFEMFSRVSYFYFLVQACLSWWDTVSPFAPFGATLALLFVLGVAAVKAVVEDRKRHIEDSTTNNSPCVHLVKDPDSGTWVERETKWDTLGVGDVVKVTDGELFPADLLCLHCQLPERICYVKTTNLDGETNLKVKRQVLQDDMYPQEFNNSDEDISKLLDITLELECEVPNANLHAFRGKVAVTRHGTSERRILPVSISEMLLRGCLLKNSGFVLGLVVYAGSESKIQKNAGSPPLKVGSFDHFLNVQVGILIASQVVLCIVCAVASYIWREVEGFDRYYLAFYSYTQGNEENGFLYTLLTFLTFWILFSYLVPISLFVTIEIVKFVQGFVYINMDKQIRADDVSARCRNSNLNEDLGKIDYVFSDKTGTLTSNEMKLRLVAIKGTPLGDVNKRVEDQSDLEGLQAVEYFSARMHAALSTLRHNEERWKALLDGAGSSEEVLAMADSKNGPGELAFDADAGEFLPYHVFDFWLNLAICHSLLVDTDPDGKAMYQGPSPDEVALVECAAALGFRFLSRSSTHTNLEILGTQVSYETLHVMEFSSDRKRMSVVIRAPDGTLKIFCKGADIIMLRRLRDKRGADASPLLGRVHDNLHFFSTKGLRTLVIATRVISQGDYKDWATRYEEANLGNDASVAEDLQDEIEDDLELVGVSAIEDKLQDGVPDAIATMITAGIKVWMITGDKQETAINISVSCNLFTNTDDLLKLNADSAAHAQRLVDQLIDQATAKQATDEPRQLVVDGGTLNHIFDADGKGLERKLATLGSLCNAVCICRASPSQKAAIVRCMRSHELNLMLESKRSVIGRWWARRKHALAGKMLGIGDGANDVAMIQAADVGIGIFGKEGRQAVNNSDYAIGQFRFLTRLLLVHGQVSHYRLRRLIKYSFYKNAVFAGILFYYQFYAGFSGQTLVDDISAALFNVVFTSLPIFCFSLLDQPCDFESLMRNPRTYNDSRGLTTWVFWKTGVLNAFLDAAICFFIPMAAASPTGASGVLDLYSVGKCIFVAMVGSLTLNIMIVARYWTVAFAVICFLSYFLVYVYILVYPLIISAIDQWDMAHQGVAQNLLGHPYFWICLITVNAMTFSLRYFERSFKWLFLTDRGMALSEAEHWKDRQGPDGYPDLDNRAARPDENGAVHNYDRESELAVVRSLEAQAGTGPAAVLKEGPESPPFHDAHSQGFSSVGFQTAGSNAVVTPRENGRAFSSGPSGPGSPAVRRQTGNATSEELTGATHTQSSHLTSCLSGCDAGADANTSEGRIPDEAGSRPSAGSKQRSPPSVDPGSEELPQM